MMIKNKKPLGIKNYGSIPHLPNSRMGPADHSCHEGQARIATKKKRDKHDIIIIQEKLDGSNVGVAKINGEIVPLVRAGYHANTSPFKQHHIFAQWVAMPTNQRRFKKMLKNGQRVVGEWLLQAHGTRYELRHEPFVIFDLMVNQKRVCFNELVNRVLPLGFRVPFTIPKTEPMLVEDVMNYIGEYGQHGAIDPIEGAVWRVERNGEVDFLVKYVRPDKVDGMYLENVTGEPPVWNKFPIWFTGTEHLNDE